MNKLTGIFVSLFLATWLVMGFHAADKAQAQSGGGFEDLNYQNQGSQSQVPPPPTGPGANEDPDGLLNRMFSGEDVAPGTQPGSPGSSGTPGYSGTPGSSGTPGAPESAGSYGATNNLPGTPSPFNVPAAPGEARIERTTPAGPTGPSATTPRRRSSNSRRTQRYATPHENRWADAQRAWAKDIPNIVTPCQSLVGDRILYHINCAANLRVGSRARMINNPPRNLNPVEDY
jgi:hypothetical protein